MSFPRYLAYKDSGVEWLGEVPEHWQAVRFSRLISAIKDGTHGTYARVSDGLPLLSAKNVLDGQLDVGESESLISESDHEEITSNGFPRKGDLLLTIVGTLGRCCVFEQNEPIAFQRSVCFIRLRNDHFPKFFYFVTQSQFFQEQLVGRSKSAAQAGVYMGDVAGMTVLLPPYNEEQKAIASFLDRETAKIDALVAEQEQLITLLKEKRQAVISNAVTKGLDPSVPMKDSGVEWLGEVPEHWAVGKCGFYIRILSGFAFPSSGFSNDESNYRLLRGANVGVSRLKWDDTVFWERTESDGLDEYEMSEGDLVIGMDRPLISEGMRVAKVSAEDLPALLLQRVASLKVGPKLHADYLHHLLSSEMFIAHFSPETTGVSVPHISPDQINNFVIPVPSIDEQRAIVEQLSNLATLYSDLINEAGLSVELLRERRSALISAAVTGQIDVRGLASQEAA